MAVDQDSLSRRSRWWRVGDGDGGGLGVGDTALLGLALSLFGAPHVLHERPSTRWLLIVVAILLCGTFAARPTRAIHERGVQQVKTANGLGKKRYSRRNVCFAANEQRNQYST